MTAFEKLRLYLRATYRAQVVSLIITIPVALAWMGYGAWWWFKRADWVEVQAVVERVKWREGEWQNETVFAGCYKFTTQRGESISACGRWEEDWSTRPGEVRQIIYDPEKPKSIARSRGDKLKWPVRILPGVYVFATFFFGFFVYRWNREDRLLAGRCQTVNAKLFSIVENGFSNSESGSEEMVSLDCRWFDADSGKTLTFSWGQTAESIESASIAPGDFCIIRFSTEDPRVFRVEGFLRAEKAKV